MPSIRKLSDIVSWRLCLGCGACSYICQSNQIELREFRGEGIRPIQKSSDCGSCTDCISVCPGVQTDFPQVHSPSRQPDKLDSLGDNAGKGGSSNPITFPVRLLSDWGPIHSIWEGFATDPDIRFRGSSGGVLTALSLYCLEVAGMEGVLHIAQDKGNPLLNRTRLSRSRESILSAAGSRYSPASVCNGLSLVESSAKPCAIVGKPSEIAGLQNARKLRPNLDAKVGVTMSFFCAETPPTSATEALLVKLGIAPSTVSDLKYRGNGWPGFFAPILQDAKAQTPKLTYRESWSFLQAHRPWSVHLWPDGSGELADITCGDPWYQQPDGRNPGSSLVVARTLRGHAIIQGAISSGYLTLQPAESWKLVQSQTGLLAKKGSVWGRRLALGLFGIPVTALRGASLFRCWLGLSVKSKAASFFGTVRRIFSKKLFRPFCFNKLDSQVVPPPISVINERDPQCNS
jgi:coenzyme F420 hydrogenase subunit beta